MKKSECDAIDLFYTCIFSLFRGGVFGANDVIGLGRGEFDFRKLINFLMWVFYV